MAKSINNRKINLMQINVSIHQSAMFHSEKIEAQKSRRNHLERSIKIIEGMSI